MVDREFHCTSLQCGRTGLPLCLLYFLVLTVDIGQHIQTLYDKSQPSLPSDNHSTLGSRMMGRKVVQESSQQSLVLKCSILHMEHYVEQQNEMVQYPAGEDFQSDTQPHTGMLVQTVSQQCKWSTVAALEDRGSLLHLLFD